ncbi:MAG: hypothetical protein PHV05_06435 [Candidatus Riflebacteria bacterium]|nr:hypothetical protein [Candidatus Riflebacteria bacterium]
MTNELAKTKRLNIIKQRLGYRRLRRLTNAVLRRPNGCPVPCPTSQDCEACANPCCVKAHAELEAYWQELDAKC